MEKIEVPNQVDLLKEYEKFYEAREQISRDLEKWSVAALAGLSSRPSVKGRIKDFSSFFKKYLRILKTTAAGGKPVINDIIGLRIICPFIEDLVLVERFLRQSFEVIEVERKGAGYSFKEFGYESVHLLIKIPQEIIRLRGDPGIEIAEIQIRTILQDAWAEVEHELVYKAEFTFFDEPMKRKLAAINASLSLADTIFQEIRNYQRQLTGELEKRRGSFFKKIEDSTDALVLDSGDEMLVPPMAAESARHEELSLASESIDDLLLSALSAHNRNRFDDAIAYYSRILELEPEDSVAAIIYKHRGMANFARSHYDEALEDFSLVLKLDPASYKAAYYRGIVRSVRQEYEAAIADYNQALALNPYQAFCFYRRAQAYYHQGDLPQALSDCEAAVSLEPLNESIRKFRDLLRGKLGKFTA